jgi:hypothetical protein
MQADARQLRQEWLSHKVAIAGRKAIHSAKQMARYPSGKGEVCKTFIRRFDSDPRLQILPIENTAGFPPGGSALAVREPSKSMNLSLESRETLEDPRAHQCCWRCRCLAWKVYGAGEYAAFGYGRFVPLKPSRF